MNQISSQPPIQTDDQNIARSVIRTTTSDQAAALRESFLVIEDGAILLDARLCVMLCNIPATIRLGHQGALPNRGYPLTKLIAHSSALDADARTTVLDRCSAMSASDLAGGEARLVFGDIVIRIRRLALGRLLLWVPASRAAGESSLHDPLTGLGNRRVFQAALAAIFTKPNASAALLMIDLDRFKQVNDTLGHPVGDALLRLVGQRLRACLSQEDVVVRLGGDEFAVLLQHLDGVDALGKRLIDLLSRPYLVEGHLANIGASIGIAVAPSDANDPSTLMRHADLALYDAKAAGRHCIRFFKSELNARAQARLALETDLRRATALNQFALYYQPLVDIASGRVTEFEALLRWQHPSRGIVSPAEFIPLAEELGLIVPIGEWVLRHACRTAVTWPADVRVAVNVSPMQFSDSKRLICAVADALTTSGLPGTRLEIEITESVLMHNNAETLETLHALRALGVSIAMDDFGTGYSSLSQLRSFPFDKVKIDRSFVSQIDGKGGSGREVVRAIAALGSNLGMTVTVEGIETDAQADFVETSGGHQMQGYLISHPVPSDMVSALFSPQSPIAFVPNPEPVTSAGSRRQRGHDHEK
jgi:diguanylate cyclase (GGDEF)-like protein